MAKNNTEEAIFKTCGKLVSGIDGGVAGENVTVTSTPEKLIIGVIGEQIEISNNEVLAVRIQTEGEVQQQYVSSAGGAVAGAMIAGAAGAAIGGRAKKKEIQTFTNFLVITYKCEGAEKRSNIVLELVGYDMGASKIVNRYNPLKAVVADNTVATKKKKKWKWIIVAILFFGGCCTAISEIAEIENDTDVKVQVSEEPEVEVYVNALDFAKISEADCVTLIGEPNSIEEWDYEKYELIYHCKSYHYDKYELVFMQNADGNYICVRMKAYDKGISFDPETVVQQFGFDRARNVNDNGVSYRCDAISDNYEYTIDFWISSYADGVINMLDITYVANAF